MMLRTVGLALVLIIPSLAQPRTPAFEVASIRPGAPGSDAQGIQVTVGNLVMRNTRLADAIRWAYNVQAFQIVGPSWIRDARFEISAKAASPAPESELRLMLQALLADRFKLVLHGEDREMSVLLLVVGKNGHKLKETTVEGSPAFRTGKLTLTGSGASLEQMTEFLSQQLQTPILNRTGLTAKYDYFLDINSFVTEEMRRGAPPIELPGIVSGAMQEQLGLKLDSSKAPIHVFVIDHVEKEPSEN